MVLTILNSHLLTARKTFTLGFIQKKYSYSRLQNFGRKKTSMRFCIKKDDDLKGDNITIETEGIVEFGNNFLKCEVVYDRAPT